MKVVVTGGTGFLGRHIVWRLASEGMDVVFTGRNRKSAEEVIRLSPAPVRWVPLEHGLENSSDRLSRAATVASAIIHCAALSSPWGEPAAFYNANVLSTAEAVAACQSTGIRRLVHISTPSLYFDFKNQLGIRECHPLPPPVNAYVRTKMLAETLVQKAFIPETVILRPRALFGPWDTTLMPRLLRVMKNGPIPLIHGGQALLDLTYISNAVDAVWRALTRTLPKPLCIYNVSNGSPLPLKDLLEKIATAFQLKLRTRHIPWFLANALATILETLSKLTHGSEPLLTRYGAGVLAFSQTLDISAISEDLGYSPQTSIEEGIRLHADWWKAHQSTPIFKQPT